MAKKYLSNFDINSNKVINLANGVSPSDAVNKSQLDAQSSGRLLGHFQVSVTESQAILSIPTIYQSKGFYQLFSDSLLIPPQYITTAPTTLTINTSTYYLSAGTVTVYVYS